MFISRREKRQFGETLDRMSDLVERQAAVIESQQQAINALRRSVRQLEREQARPTATINPTTN